MYIYGNWAAYDELSDGIELTEELAMRQLDELLRFRAHGVKFDGYLMDAFWYAPGGAYREWRQPHWPEGPDRWIAACKANGLLPGLWFMVNGLTLLEPSPVWQDSLDEERAAMCLFEGGYLGDYLDILDHWYRRGIRIFKFDFANFDAVPTGRMIPDARARNYAAFQEAMIGFRANHPEAILLGYNGFEDRPCMDRTDRSFGPYIDPKWLEVFDALYSGDPRPSDVPCASFWRSVDVYADHMVQLFEKSGIPRERIENCGFMAGPTGTCYWRSKAGWKQMLLLSLARGGKYHVPYGDLSLFTDEDAEWWAGAQALFEARGIGHFRGGVPGQADPYVWIYDDLVIAVNPAISPRTFSLGSEGYALRGSEPGFDPELSGRKLTLGGGQMAILQREDAPPLTFDFGFDDTARVSGKVHCVASKRAPGHSLELETDPKKSRRLQIVAQQFYPNGDVCRSYPGHCTWPPLKLSVQCEGRTTDLPSVIEKIVWSGLSWQTGEIDLTGTHGPILVRADSAEPADIEIHLDVYRVDPE